MQPKIPNNHVKLAAALALALCAGSAAQAQLIDDFSGSLSPYTLSPMLYANSSGTPTTTISFTDPSGALQATAANYNAIEQALFLRNDYSLAIGKTLTVDVNWSLGNSQDLGLAVASTATPTTVTGATGNADSRSSLSYAYVGIRGDAWHIVSSGFDGSTALTTQQYQPGSGAATSLFITRTSATTFDMGYNMGSGNTVLTTYTFANSANVGDAIGFYADMRAAGSIGTFDNLQIVPEPSTLALLGLGFGALLFRRKRA